MTSRYTEQTNKNMTILVFWKVGVYEVERHTLDAVSDVEAFDILWHMRDELNARIYNMDTSSYSDPFGQYGILNASDFEEDYNDEYLDGGHWTKVIRIDEDYVKQIVEE